MVPACCAPALGHHIRQCINSHLACSSHPAAPSLHLPAAPCRADGQGPWWYVPEGKCCDSWARPTVPATSDNFYQWYFFMEPGNDYSGTPTFVLRYKLPARFACERCILQWWVTRRWCSGAGAGSPCDKQQLAVVALDLQAWLYA